MLALARRRHELAAGLPEADIERFSAAGLLTDALRVSGQYEEALGLARATLTTARRVFGPEQKITLALMHGVPRVHASRQRRS